MKLLDLTLPSPAENLALDEALLEEAEEGRGDETLRFWEPAQTFVVLGRSSRAGQEARLDRCRADNIPVLRRSSGGAAIVTGPGCLMYAVVLSYERHPDLRMIERAHRFVLGITAEAIRQVVLDVEMLGTSDLTRQQMKFSGNSLRCKRHYFLYHGTLLYDFPLDVIADYLGTPPRQPEYREQRDHASFVRNLPASADQLRDVLRTAWNAGDVCPEWPRQRTAELVEQRYSRDEWNLRI
jgi:lipoate-protein ligase A